MLRHRRGKFVRRTMTTREGVRLREVVYRIPYPRYKNKGCSPVVTEATPEEVVEGLWAAALENVQFAQALDAIGRGLGLRCHRDHALGLGLHSTAGAALTALAMSAQKNGVLPLLLRATELPDDGARARFVAAWTDPPRRAELARLAARLLTLRTKEEDVAFHRELAAIGLRPRVLKPSEQQAANASHARTHLRFIINASASIGGG